MISRRLSYRAVPDAKKAGYACAILDETLIPVDRVAADRPSCSGRHKKHGLVILADETSDVP